MAAPSNQPKKSAPQEDIIEYVKTHMRETITCLLLLIGIILMTYDTLYGGLLVGIIGGVYFGEEVVNFLMNLPKALQSPATMTRSVVALGVGVALFITGPAIFLGAAIAIGIQQLFYAPKA